VKQRQISTPLKELQVMYDLAVESTLAHDPDRLKGRDPKTAKALEKVRTHFGLKEYKKP
jgi:hypothetical protein